MITQHIIFHISLLNPCVINDYVSFQLKWPSGRPLQETKPSVLRLVKAATNTLFSRFCWQICFAWQFKLHKTIFYDLCGLPDSFNQFSIPPFYVRGIICFFCFQFSINIVLISSTLVYELNFPFKRPLF